MSGSFKIIIIGNSGVGKSCLSLRGTKNYFRNDYLSTIGFDYFKFNIKLFDKDIKYNKDKDNEDDQDYKIIRLHIWDTCGQEVYRSLVTNYYKNSSLAILVYAIDDQESFEDINLWYKELKDNANPDIKIILVGNKSDLQDKKAVDDEDVKKIMDEFEIDLNMETSAKTGENVEKLFVEASRILYNEYKSINNNNKKKKKDAKKKKKKKKLKQTIN